jgi:hypothetical protein
VYPEFLGSLNLKWARPAGRNPVNLGYITKAGALWTDAAAWSTPKELARVYVAETAAALGCDVREMPNGDEWTLYRNGKPLRIREVLDRLPAWITAMQHFITAIARHDAAGT